MERGRRQITTWGVLFFILMAQPAVAGSNPFAAPAPSSEPTDWIKVEFKKVRDATPGLCRRLLMSVMRGRIQQKARDVLTSEALSATAGGSKAPLTDAELQLATKAAIETAIQRVKYGPQKVVGSVVMVGLMLGNAKLASILIDAVPKSESFLTMFITQMSLVCVFVLGSRFLDPFSAMMKRFGFWLVPPEPSGTHEVAGTHISPDLEQAWERFQKYGNTAQIGSNRLQNHLNQLETRLARVHRESQQQAVSPEDQRRYIVEQLAAIVLWARIFSQDVPIDSIYSLVAVRTVFMNHYRDKEGLADEVYQSVLALDSKSNDPAIQTYYRSLVDIWFK